MQITVIGTGYVGLVTGTCFADLGHNVICLDIKPDVVEKLSRGEVHFYEPGLSELVKQNLAEKRLRFTLDAKEAIQKAQIIFICVGTPSKADGSADLSYIFSAVQTIAKHMNSYKVIVNKSTAPVGTIRKIKNILADEINGRFEFDIVSNPETLREGSAVRDFKNPDRIIAGVESQRAERVMNLLYNDFVRVDKPILFLKIESSELSKYASNAMLAARISFMNELAPLCEKTGADIKEIAKAIGLDERIGPRFLQAGAGYGGSCFPKDVLALASSLEEHGLQSNLITSIHTANEQAKKRIFEKLQSMVGSIKDKNICLLGLSFKPKTDDLREAPSVILIQQLLSAGAKIKAFDPVATENAKRIFDNVAFCLSSEEAMKGADAVVLMTEWDEFRNMDKQKMRELMTSHHVLDARNIWDSEEMQFYGFNYKGVGR